MLEILAILGIYAAIYITNPFIIIFHELGHAFAHLILTKPKKINVFIGSYGDTKTKLNLKIGKLHFYVKPSLFFINGGICQSYSAEPSYKKRVIILLAGPLVSFFVACLIGFFVFDSEIHGVVKLYFFALIICSFISLITNLRPSTIKNTNIDNDGKQLLFTIRIRKVYTDYVLANEKFLRGEYIYSAEQFLQIIAFFPHEENIMRPLITSLLMTKRWTEAEKYLTEFTQYRYPNTEDYLNWGYLHSVTNRSQLAIENYKKALSYDPNNLIGLNNLGYELALKGEYAEGQKILEQAIEIDPKFSHPYGNLGYLKILSSKLDEGKQLIEKSIELDPNNAYAYKHLGVYYLKTGDKGKALVNFNKALELDSSFNMESFFQEAELLS